MAKGSSSKSSGGKGSSGKGTSARSSVTGRYVKPVYAKTHPNTTEIEKRK